TTGNGVVVNQRLSPSWLGGAHGTELLAALVRGYFEQGGAQVQFNVVDSDTLRRAQQHPQAYRDLVVRISGYSAYFNDLTPPMQEELIARCEHAG
ncbi:MAG: formate C-acetyltransferase/glycerol dehydratase family glycyl radical enzyme, partial [Deltaproteobacteria bacterium]|nr:formate C-acetyltransferase/glycerol dehydratase family glycyl radical enzyme [Deltaproteobacteria bacterium]MBW2537293.1 formate C-acetyltransferase/glycerol dehydratase family glycyl radical enzyme [Deltaproteobacteria bacterium]